MKAKDPVYLVDGSAYIYRAYHAIAPLTNSGGLPTHAVYGFVNILLRVLKEKAPKYLAVAWDMKGPTFRHQMYDQYKANRPPMPDDLVCQIPYIRDVVAAYNIVGLAEQGFEADDLLASAAKALEKAGHPVILITGDKDLLQLVNENITFWDPMHNRLFDPEAVHKKYNVGPEKLNDLFALMGDSADNVPGVAGVGPKGAEKLINQFGSLQGLYDNIDQLKKSKQKEKLIESRDMAFLSQELIALRYDLSVPAAAEDYIIPAPNEDKLRELYTFLGFNRLLKKEVSAPKMDTTGFTLVQTRQALEDCVAELSSGELLVVDTETSSLDPLTAELVGISLCNNTQKAYYVPLAHRLADGTRCEEQLAWDEAGDILQPLLTDEKLPKLGHNIKFDYSVLLTQGVKLGGPLWDSMIASYLVDPARRSHKLDDLCEQFLELRLTPFAEMVGKGGKKGREETEVNFGHVGIDKAGDYSCEDVHGALLLWQYFRPRLEELDLWDLFTEVEMETVPVLAVMERAGIKVDTDILAAMADEFATELASLEKDIHAMAGESFNIKSPQQLGEILFEKLKLPHGRKTKTGYSTDVKVLEKLQNYHDLPGAVVNYRNLSKLKSTYIDKLITQVHSQTGRVHTSFNQTVTATGRLSSSNPNLQNIPIRTPEGQRIRSAFVAEGDKVLLGADYSQIDLRVLAHYSQDAALLAAFRAGDDVHNQTAVEVFRVSAAFVTKEMRRVAKTINFGIVYGMSAFGLAAQLNLSRKEAATFIERYFEHYSGVKIFMAEIVEQAKKDGYVTTLLKRRRPLPDITSSNKTRREFAERTAINTPIQGTAADIIKLATIAVDKELRTQGLSAKPLLQIHDELVFEVEPAELEQTAALVKEVMENVMPLDVPLVVNTASGANLAET